MKKNRRPKRRTRLTKRRRSNTKKELEFSMTAKDSSSKEAVAQKAKEHGLNCFGKGHAKNRLYFRCAEKTWSHFYTEIKHLCLVDGPGRCPARLQKKMLKNLSAAAYSNIDLARAKIAERLLAVVKRNADKPASQVQAKTEKADGRIRANSQPLKSPPNVSFRMRKSISNAFRKSVSSLQTFVSRKKHLQPAHS